MIKILLLFAACYLVYAVISTVLTYRRLTRPAAYRDIT